MASLLLALTFTWKAEPKDAEDIHISSKQRLQTKLFNIEHNSELSEREKWRAIDKVKDVPLGTSEQVNMQEKQELNETKIRQDLLQRLNRHL